MIENISEICNFGRVSFFSIMLFGFLHIFAPNRVEYLPLGLSNFFHPLWKLRYLTDRLLKAWSALSLGRFFTAETFACNIY